MSVYLMSTWCLLRPEAALDPQTLDFQRVGIAMWVLGIKLSSSVGAASALNSQAILVHMMMMMKMMMMGF